MTKQTMYIICVFMFAIILLSLIYSRMENFDINSRIYKITKVAKVKCQNAKNKKDCVNRIFNFYSKYLL
jgi:hypothetical protein